MCNSSGLHPRADRFPLRHGGGIALSIVLAVMLGHLPLRAEEPPATDVTSADAKSAETSDVNASAADMPPVEASVSEAASAPAPAAAAASGTDETPPVAETPPAVSAENEPDAPPVASAANADQQLAKIPDREAVKFVTNVRYLSENRPSWLEAAPEYDGDLYRVAVKAGPYRTVRDCEPDLEREVDQVVSKFVNQHLKAPHASTFIHYSLDELRRRGVVKEQFSEQLETSLGLMNQVHAQLAFDNSFRDELDGRWSEVKSSSRLAQTGLGAGVIVLLLGTLFGYLKVDTATRGYYTGRLQFLTAGMILALVAASVVLARLIPWM